MRAHDIMHLHGLYAVVPGAGTITISRQSAFVQGADDVGSVDTTPVNASLGGENTHTTYVARTALSPECRVY